jgi:hypothetical protein
MKKLGALLLVVSFVAAGCFNETPKVTPDQEKTFRNPPKEMPSAASEAMKKAQQDAQQKAQGK